MDGEVSEILAQIGWDSEHTAPIASARCKKLQQQLTSKRLRCAQLQGEIKLSERKVCSLRSRLQSSREQANSQSSLLAVREKQIQSQHHMCRVVERERGHLEQSAAEQRRRLVDIEQRSNSLLANVNSLQSALDASKQEAELDDRALETWLQKMVEHDDTLTVVYGDMQADSAQLNKISHQLERASSQRQLELAQLHETCAQLGAVTKQVDSMAEEYRHTVQRIQEQLAQWRGVLQQIEARQKQIETAGEKIESLQAFRAQLEQKRKDVEQFREQEERNSDEVRVKVMIAEKRRAQLYQAQRASVEQANHAHHELESLKGSLARSLMLLKQKRNACRHTSTIIEQRKRQLVRMKKEKVKAELALKEVHQLVASSGQKYDKLKARFEEEEVRQKKIKKSLTELTGLIFEKTCILKESKSEETIKANEIQTFIALRSNLKNKMIALNEQLMEQKYLTHEKDTDIENLLRRVERMKGSNLNADESSRLKKRIACLRDNVLERQKEINFLVKQIKHVDRLCGEVEHSARTFTEQLERCDWQESELKLAICSCERELRGSVEQRHDYQVELTMMQLSVRQLRAVVGRNSSQAASDSQRKLQMQAELRQRRCQADLERSSCQLQLRTLREELGQLEKDVFASGDKVVKIKARYEVMLAAMSSPDLDGPPEQAHLYLTIRAVQEKEQVKHEGDLLDAKVKKTEKELEALRNTCLLLKKCNGDFERRLGADGVDQEEAERRAELQEMLKRQQADVKQLYQLLDARNTELHQLEHQIQRLNEDIGDAQQQKSELDQKSAGVTKELNQQQEKLNRAACVIKKLLIKVRKNKSAISKVHLDEIELKRTRRAVRFVSKQLGEFVSSMNISDNVKQVLEWVFSEQDDESTTSSAVSSLSRISISSCSSFGDGSHSAQSSRSWTSGTQRQLQGSRQNSTCSSSSLSSHQSLNIVTLNF